MQPLIPLIALIHAKSEGFCWPRGIQSQTAAKVLPLSETVCPNESVESVESVVVFTERREHKAHGD